MKDQMDLRIKQDKIVGARDEDYDNPILQAKDEMIGFLLGEMESPVESIEKPPTTDDDIDALIVALKAEYKDLPEYSLFGDPNWGMRDAGVEILEWAKTETTNGE